MTKPKPFIPWQIGKSIAMAALMISAAWLEINGHSAGGLWFIAGMWIALGEWK